jgi:hypothetical protein
VEEREVAVGELHEDLPVNVGAISRVVGPPGLGNLRYRPFKIGEILRERTGL